MGKRGRENEIDETLREQRNPGFHFARRQSVRGNRLWSRITGAHQLPSG